MALTKCPECGRDVSTAATACPHCGFPMSQVQQNICKIHGVPYDLTNVLNVFLSRDIPNDDKRLTAYRLFRAQRERTLGVAELSTEEYLETSSILKRIEKTGKVPPEYPFPDTPRCPTCGSTDIRKLSAGARGVSLGLFGLASKTARSQFVCDNCGYKW